MTFAAGLHTLYRLRPLLPCAALLAILNTTALAENLPQPILLNQGWRLQDTAKVSGDGAAISGLQYDARSWYAATVPGTVLTTLVDNGVYPEPLYGMNNLQIPDSLCQISYWYRKSFTLPKAFVGRHVWLNFQGINHKADVWVNGKDIGRIEGAFIRGIFDITSEIDAGGNNMLAVQIIAPAHHSGGSSNPSNPVLQTLANNYGPNGGNMEGDAPTFFCAEGWDWIPTIHDRDMGIWQDVTLSATGSVVIRNPYVTNSTVTTASDSVDLTLQVELKNVTGQPQIGTLQGTIAGHKFSRTVTVPANDSSMVTLTANTVPELHLAHPDLWWPNGYGAQKIYSMPLTFTVADEPSDSQTVNFGVRTITYGITDKDSTLKMSVNGVPIMMRGGNWGMDEALKRSPLPRLEAQIKLHHEAGFTMIRNWCGQTTQEQFYALCDKYGILVWNDFWLDDTVNYPLDAAMFLANERDTLLRFRQHPSIALWCERNEFPIGPFFEKDILKLTAELDPQRWMQPCSSSQYGVGDGNYGIEPLQHYFDPFKDGFHTETGAPSIPSIEALHDMMPESDWGTFNDDWTQHDMCQFNYAPALTARYGPVADTPDFVRKAHLADYETYRAMFEGRNAHLLDPNTGILFWMSNPAQPSLVWQLYNYDLEPNAAYFGAKHACEMVHAQMSPQGNVQVINNSPQARAGLTVTAAVYNMDGTHAFDQTAMVSATATAATDAFAIKWPASLSAVHFVRLTLIDAQKKQLDGSFYWHTSNPGHDCSALQTLAPAKLDVTAHRKDASGNTTLSITLSNRTKSVALMSHLQIRHGRKNARVLPIYYSDNFISLMPGESRNVNAEFATSDLHGDEPQIAVDGWNVTAAAWKGSHVSVIPALDAGLAKPARITGIDCGVGWLPGYASDCFVEGGNTACTDDAINTSGVHMAAPAILYRTERNGECMYTIPLPSSSHGVLLPQERGKVYTVILHFAENYWRDKGQRMFNVDINGERKLSDFDIFAAAGGRNRANVQVIQGIHADKNGDIVIRFIKGSADQPKVSGIEIR